MTEENKPPQDPETLMSFEPTQSPEGQAAPPPPARRTSRLPTGGNPRVPTSQIPAARSTGSAQARTTPQTMAENAVAAVTGGRIIVGTKLGQIEITGVLGKGGMGLVFRGYHAALDIDVAIKVLPDELSRNEVVRQRFLREARLCIKLDHPHIVRVFNVDEWQGNLYLVLELIEGTDAAAMLKDGGRFKYKRALEIGRAAAEALAYAHQQGLVHRDVKPHNILLGAQDGKIKLSDFGLARAASSASHLTMSGQIMGTPHYMSPEQAESKEVNDKSDVYSLGVTIYHQLTGETPFVGDTPISVAVQHIAKEILYPEMRFAAFPKELVAVLKRMTAKDSAKRCNAKQAAVWLQKLHSMAGDEDISAEPAAMRSLAPVVAESEAFRMAAEKRKVADARAREEAKSMVVMQQTMREALASAERTLQEKAQPKPEQPAPAAQSAPQIVQPQPASGGMGKMLVGAFMLLVLAGGGAAGWYFTLGPGAKQNPNSNNTIIGSDGQNLDNRPQPGNSPAGNAPAGNTPPTNTPETNTPTNKPPANNSPVNGTETGKPTDSTTPPVQDNPVIAAKLTSCDMGISGAKSADDLKLVRRELDLLGMEIDKGSAKQREAFLALEKSYLDKNAYVRANDQLDIMEAALEAHKKNAEADDLLNTALAAWFALDKLNIPAGVLTLISERRVDLSLRVKAALDIRHDQLLKKAEAEASDGFYEVAEETFAKLLNLHLDEKRKQTATARRDAVAWDGRVKGTEALINNKKYGEVKKRLGEDKLNGVPPAQADRFNELEKKYEAAVEADLTANIATAREMSDIGKFNNARVALEEAGKLSPILGNSQLVRLDEARLYVNVSEPVSLAVKAVDSQQYAEAQKQIAAADAQIANAKDSKMDEALAKRLTEIRSKLSAQVSLKFIEIMSAAKNHVALKEFSEAGACIQQAEELPLDNPKQVTELQEFKNENAQKLRQYVLSLLTEAENALENGEFDKADAALKKASHMLLTQEADKARLAALLVKFADEAVKRFNALFGITEKAIEDSEFALALESIAKLRKLPVAKSLVDKIVELESRLNQKLSGAVTAKLREAEELSEKGNYNKAYERISEATALALTDELQRKCTIALSTWGRDVEDAFDVLLKSARDSQELKKFTEAEKALKEAEALPLSKLATQQKLTLRLSDAVDALKKARTAHIDALFKQLEQAVADGKEKEGDAIVATLNALTLSISEQLKLKRLKESLSGESRDKRIERMPPQLKKMANDRYLQAEQIFKVDESIEAVAASSDGKIAAIGTSGGKVVFYNLRRGTLVGQSTGGRRAIKSLAVSPDGKWGVCGNDDGYVVLFDLAAATMRTLQLATLGDDITGLGFSVDSKVVFVLVKDGNLVRYTVANQTQIASSPTGITDPNALAMDPTGTLVAVGGDDGEIQIFDSKQMVAKRNAPMKLPNGDIVQKLCFSADGKWLAGGSIGDGVGVWETSRLTEKPVAQMKGLDEWIKGLGFSSDGRRCCGFDSEKRFVIWDAKSGASNKTYEFDQFKREKRFLPRAGYVGPDGTLLLGTEDGELLHMTVKPAG